MFGFTDVFVVGVRRQDVERCNFLFFARNITV